MSVKLFDNDSVSIQGDAESDLRGTICLGCIVPNIVYGQFQKSLCG